MDQERVDKEYLVFISDDRVRAIHISLYLALLHCWLENNFQLPLQVTRRNLMRLSHIQSIVTYHRLMRQLSLLGYIQYEPSYNPFLGSKVYLKKLSDQV